MEKTQDMRATYNDTLIELAAENERIVILEADLMNASGTVPFKKKYPERAFDMGVAEANMAGTAAGLSSVGKIPFAASFTPFASRKAYDQFFISANYARLNVKLVGTDPGVTATFNGGTHMSFEDGGLMRNIPKLTVFEPCDNISLRKLVRKAAEHQGCTYMRLHRKGGQEIYSDDTEFELGKGMVLRDGNDVTLVATGFVMVPEALAAAAELEKEGISAAVIDMHTVKPIDRELIVEYARKTGAFVTCENHQVVNFLGSAVAEVLAEDHPALLGRIGIQDEFGQVGTLDFLKKDYGLTAADIAAKAREVLKKKANMKN
ncbi:MAG: transketolase family protein [Sediminispirochaetaceae bacterium]